MQKDSKVALIFCGAIVGLLVLSFALKSNNAATVVTDDNSAVSMQDGVQVIDLTAKGGYTPKFVEAKAGVATELRVATQGTFDCSASLVILELDYDSILEPTGVETIAIAANKAQGTLEGTCGMGMYDFEIAFK
jgi:plastocyanin domain-containing protein